MKIRENMKNFINKNLNSVILLIVVGIIVFISYFLDKNLSKILGVAGFFVWFLREFSKQLLTKDLEKFKAELQKESIKFKIRFEKLQTERAEVIKKVYKNIIRTYTALSQYFLLDFYLLKIDSKKYKDINKSMIDELRKCTNYFTENRIYFEEDLAQKIDKLIFNYTEIKIQIDKKNNLKIVEGVAINVKKLTLHEEENDKIWKRIMKQLPNITREIEHHFREIIGISNN